MAHTLLHSALPRRDRIRRHMLLLAGADDESVRGHTMLQKMLYVLAKDIGDSDVESSFRPHDYGPYSQQVADGLDGLSKEGLVSHVPGKIALTPAGRVAAGNAGSNLNEAEVAILRECKRFFNNMTNEQLLLYIYLSYPDMAANSRVCDSIVPRAEDIVMDMVKDEKISSGRAAEILKVPFRDILYMMKRRDLVNLY